MARNKEKTENYKKLENKDYAILGKALTRVFARDYLQVAENWKRFIFLSFVRGLFIGLGSVLGATILLGLLIWVLSIFNDVPWVGDITENFQETIQNYR
ncbi:MAG: DUF5665 domain-containing protein [Candidatus Saccharimonadales bacterium]